MLDIDSEVLAAFAEETSERLGTLESGLLELERSPRVADPDLLNAIFRDAHSIKAGANLLDFRHFEAAAHRMENVLDCLRKGLRLPGPDVIQPLLEGVDLLRVMLQNPSAPPPAHALKCLAVLSSLDCRSGRPS